MTRNSYATDFVYVTFSSSTKTTKSYDSRYCKMKIIMQNVL